MKLPLIVTAEGLDALVDAQIGTTNAVTIAEIGLTASHFAAAPTLTALPGEFKRLSTVAGEAVSDTMLHMVARDDGAESYTVAGLGLYTDAGVLFGVFSHAADQGPIFVKSEIAAFLFAADVVFESGVPGLIEFGTVTFLYPPATLSTKGVAKLASAAEVAAGVDAEKIVTPATLGGAFVKRAEVGAPLGVPPLDAGQKIPAAFLPAQDSIDTFYASSEAEMLALAAAGPGDFCQRDDLEQTFRLAAAPPSELTNWVEFLSPGAPVRTVNGQIGNVVLDADDVGAVPVGRAVTGGGLATGGGTLDADRAITVAIASAAEALAGLVNDKALTPASLASVLAAIGARVSGSRQVATSGLATGGGDLSADRTINVAAASAADVEAMVAGNVAVTPAALAGTLRSIGATGFLRIPGTPLILQWGNGTHTASHGTNSFSFPVTFPAACFQVLVTPYGDPDDGDESDENVFCSSRSQTGFAVSTGGDSRDFVFGYLALGI